MEEKISKRMNAIKGTVHFEWCFQFFVCDFVNPIPPGRGGGGGAFDARAKFEQLAIPDNLRESFHIIQTFPQIYPAIW